MCESGAVACHSGGTGCPRMMSKRCQPSVADTIYS